MKFRICRIILLVLSCFILSILCGSAFASSTELVSISTSGVQGYSAYGGTANTYFTSVSNDGRYVVFATDCGTLVTGDTNGKADVFIRDRTNGTTEILSVSSTSEMGNGACTSNPYISGNGRYVVFSSDSSNLVPGDTNGVIDVFVRDTVALTTERVSVSSAGEQGNNNSNGAYIGISTDGRYVAFRSSASNLVSDDTNAKDDVFVRDRINNTTERVSISSSGEQGNDNSPYMGISISADGRYVAFDSSASNLIPEDTNAHNDSFVRDRVNNTTERVSISTTGEQGNGEGLCPSISANGRYITFICGSDNFIASDANGWTYDIYVRDRLNATTELVSKSSSGIQANQESIYPTISADGRYIAFRSYATNLDASSVSAGIYVRDLENQTTERISVSNEGVPSAGRYNSPSISADGRYVTFNSDASTLVSGDTNGKPDAFLRDRAEAPTNFSLAPDTGNLVTGSRINMTSVYTDHLGANNINTCYLLVNSSFSNDAGYLFYNVAKNRLYLRPPGSTTLIGGYAPGKAQVIDNGFLVLNCAQTTVQKIGNTLTIKWSVTFKQSFAGSTCNAWMRVTNKAGLVDPWEQMGSFSMLVNPTPKNESLSPNSGTITVDTPTTIASVYSDPAGYANIKTCYMMMNIGATTSGAGYCYYDPVKNKLYLRETGSSTLKGGFAPGSANTIDNGNVTLNCADTSVVKAGNNLTVNWNITLKAYFLGNPIKASMQVTNKTGQSDIWEQMGSFNID